eukprot:CAMPEP_0175059664 /NCGR_PEP_ID=MMETSP0052_2-20121109/12560_1 /TAXON_ID=51329 ORGANISM="Polytomella parva, Strain SAG 63-3" /NCGR_SAMPLE_ID=MMETSP0052_2 /ASSEMBLY_ACC=CAM_ASM_000194 /LENGTH=260 /DNA_ID=CAMNT_0016325243 /DNA_START=177 /DNA_END=959 /DNA_ORIENTATION=+
MWKGKTSAEKANEEAEDEKKKARDELIKMLSSRQSMDLNGYINYIREEVSKLTPPRPKKAPVPRNHEDYNSFLDEERVAYMRMKNHEKIALFLTEEEKNIAIVTGKDIIKDAHFIRKISSRTGFYIDREIHDFFKEFFEFRDNSRLMLGYFADRSNPDFHNSSDFGRKLNQLREEDTMSEKNQQLAKRDRDNCPVIPVLSVTGADVICSNTGLHFWECCGAGAVKAPIRHKPEPEKRRLARAEKKYREMEAAQGKPKFLK